MDNSAMDLQEVVKRAIKYFIEGAAVGLAMFLISMNKKSFSVEEILMVAVVAAAVFAILDLAAPSVSYAARQGAGFGIGANLVGFPRVPIA